MRCRSQDDMLGMESVTLCHTNWQQFQVTAKMFLFVSAVSIQYVSCLSSDNFVVSANVLMSLFS